MIWNFEVHHHQPWLIVLYVLLITLHWNFEPLSSHNSNVNTDEDHLIFFGYQKHARRLHYYIHALVWLSLCFPHNYHPIIMTFSLHFEPLLAWWWWCWWWWLSSSHQKFIPHWKCIYQCSHLRAWPRPTTPSWSRTSTRAAGARSLLATRSHAFSGGRRGEKAWLCEAV